MTDFGVPAPRGVQSVDGVQGAQGVDGVAGNAPTQPTPDEVDTTNADTTTPVVDADIVDGQQPSSDVGGVTRRVLRMGADDTEEVSA